MQFIDVTAPIDDSVRPYIPNVPYARVEPLLTLDKDGVESHLLTVTTLSGTYFETGRHVDRNAPTIDAVAPHNFVRAAVLLDVGVKGAGEPITPEDLRRDAELLKAGEAAVVRTGWSRKWNTPRYFDDSPYFTSDALELLLSRRIRILAGDFPSFDSRRSPQGIVKKLFADGTTYLLAPLVNLEQVTQRRITVFAFPMSVRGLSGAPARVLISERIQILES